jgi:hypothetical protein
MNKNMLRPVLLRLLVITVISLAFALAFNEITYMMQKDPADRSPQTISLMIPYGTNARLEAGENINLMPEDITFVIGDVLEVKNNDIVPHQLGPIWTPPGATGRLVMEKAEKVSYNCSFQSTQYLGFEVRPATTIGTRIMALLLTVPTLAALLFLYSLALYPIKTTAPNKAAS